MNADDTNTPDERDESDQPDPGAGSGEGDSLGTPGGLTEEPPPSIDQEANEAVSGGGMVQPDAEDDAKDTVRE